MHFVSLKMLVLCLLVPTMIAILSVSTATLARTMLKMMLIVIIFVRHPQPLVTTILPSKTAFALVQRIKQVGLTEANVGLMEYASNAAAHVRLSVQTLVRTTQIMMPIAIVYAQTMIGVPMMLKMMLIVIPCAVQLILVHTTPGMI
jgi:hypothetical protein